MKTQSTQHITALF